MNVLSSLGFTIFVIGSIIRNNIIIFSGLIFSGVVLLIFTQEMVSSLVSINKTTDPKSTRYFAIFSSIALIALGIYGLLGGQFGAR